MPFPGPLQYSPIPVPQACHPSTGKAGSVFVEQRAAQPLVTGEERPGAGRPFLLLSALHQASTPGVPGGHWGHRGGLDLKCGLREQSERRRERWTLSSSPPQPSTPLDTPLYPCGLKDCLSLLGRCLPSASFTYTMGSEAPLLLPSWLSSKLQHRPN